MIEGVFKKDKKNEIKKIKILISEKLLLRKLI